MRFHSLKAKILLIIILAVVVIEGVFLYLIIRPLSQQMIKKTEEEAFTLSETIRLSIRNAMIKDRRDEYQRIINDVAQRKGIIEVRIFNKQGQITVSSDSTKVGTVVDKQVGACYGCHREDQAKFLLPSDSKARIYQTEKQKLLGLINPIYNEPSCYSCHPKTLNVLGVLDIMISLEGFEKEKAQIYKRVIISGVVSVIILCFLLSLILIQFVNRPIDKLLAVTKTVAHGNLDQPMAIRSHDELGELADSFNLMISELKRSRNAIEESTQTLEHQVREQTAELTKVNEVLKDREEYLKNLFNSMHAGILVVDAETHNIFDINPVAAEMIGVRKEQILGLACHKFVCPAEVGKCPITDLKQTVHLSERKLLKATGEQISILKSVRRCPFTLIL